MKMRQRRDKIAILEDDPDLRFLFSEWLNREYEATAFSNSGDLLRDIVKLNPALVVLDVNVAGHDGLEAARAVRSLPTLTRTPLLAATGHAFNTEKVERLKRAGVAYLKKPFTAELLLSTVREQLQQRFAGLGPDGWAQF